MVEDSTITKTDISQSKMIFVDSLIISLIGGCEIVVTSFCFIINHLCFKADDEETIYELSIDDLK